MLKCLYTTFKDVDEVQLLEAIYKVRDTNGGNLLNIPDYVLVAEIKKILMKKNKNGKTAWSSVSQVHWQNDHSESKCCICFEDFNPNNSHMLACQHEFHKKVRKATNFSSSAFYDTKWEFDIRGVAEILTFTVNMK